MTFYAMKQYTATTAKKYRLTVSLETAWITGAAFHSVKIESAMCYKTLRGKWALEIGGYEYDHRDGVHCCYNGREAAAYIAEKLGATLA